MININNVQNAYHSEEISNNELIRSAHNHADALTKAMHCFAFNRTIKTTLQIFQLSSRYTVQAPLSARLGRKGCKKMIKNPTVSRLADYSLNTFEQAICPLLMKRQIYRVV